MPSGMAVVLGVALWMAVAGCVTSAEWQEWRAHSSHFAAGQHGIFSMRNPDSANPWVSRADLIAAQTGAGWGRVITVSPEQIFEPR